MEKPATPPVVEVTDEKAAQAVECLKSMIESNHAQSAELRIALFALCSYMKVVQWVGQRGIGIKMLRHLLGLESPEPPPPTPSPKGGGDNKGKKGRHNHGRRGAKDFQTPKHRYFAHPTLEDAGVICPGCEKGGLYPHYGQWHRFEGQPLLRVLVVNYEIWRCTLCAESYSASIADDILLDGKVRQSFGYSAVALIVISKHFLGTPWARQERLQTMLKLPLSASTLHDQTHEFAKAASPVYEYLMKKAASGWLFCSDDTGIRILKLKSEIKTQRKTQKETLRTGVHTSAILSTLEGGVRVALFKSGILHAGEFLDEILKHRDEGLPAPLHMADGSSCNPATVLPTIQAACNAHGRRKLDEKKETYPEHWEVVRKVYREVYQNDAKTKELGFSPTERLKFHKENSRPVMVTMFDWMRKELETKNVEPNSQLGSIFEYFIARETALLAFTEHEGAPLDNNAVEQLIKLVALLRKNAMFFLSLNGANDADKILSVGATAGMAGVNLYEYFVAVQRFSSEVEKCPENFLPWNYQQTISKLESERTKGGRPAVRELTAALWKERQERFRNQRLELRKRRSARNISPKKVQTN
jgi:transposase